MSPAILEIFRHMSFVSGVLAGSGLAVAIELIALARKGTISSTDADRSLLLGKLGKHRAPTPIPIKRLAVYLSRWVADCQFGLLQVGQIV